MKPLFPLLFAFAALAPSTAAAQDIETINQGAPSGYVKGAGSYSGPFFVSRDGVLYASNAWEEAKILVKYPASKPETTYTIDPDCTRIARGAFEGARNLQVINIPSRCVAIGEGAFDGCTALRAINYGTAGTPTAAPAPTAADAAAAHREVARYNLAGQPVGPAEKGLQIIVYDDFTTRTLIVE